MEQDHAMSEYGILAKVQLWETYRNPGECLLHFRGWKTIQFYSYTQKPLYQSLSTNQYVMVHVTYRFLSLLKGETQSWPVDSHAWMAAEMETYHPVCWWILRFTLCVAKWFIGVETSRCSTIFFVWPRNLDYSSKSPARNLFQNGFSFDETLLNLFLDLICPKTWKSFEDADGPAGAGMVQYPQAQAEYGIFDWQDSVLGCVFFLSKASNVMEFI